MVNYSEKQIQDILIAQVAMILSLAPSAIKLDTPLHTLGVDSLSFVELLVFIEKKFALKLMDSGALLKDFYTIGSLAQCISRLKADET